MNIFAEKNKKLILGRQGENLITAIRFPIQRWIDEFGNGTFLLVHKRSQDKEAYPCATHLEGDELIWEIYSSDVEYVGDGLAQLSLLIGEKVAKSEVFHTSTLRSLDATENPPEAWRAWVDQVLEATTHYPRLSDRNTWMQYVNGGWIDTGVSAEGKDGYTPRKGIDYFDGRDGRDGRDGTDGRDGVDGLPGRDGTDGRDGIDGRDGVDGKDYVLTENDKSQIAGIAKEKIDPEINALDGKYIGYDNLTGDFGSAKSIVAKIKQPRLYVKEGLVMGGTAFAAGLVTRGICGATTPTDDGYIKDSLYLNYDGSNVFNPYRQVILQAGNAGEHYGNNMYQYAVPRGDIVKDWVDSQNFAKELPPVDAREKIGIVTITQAEYDAITPDENTIYIIVG